MGAVVGEADGESVGAVVGEADGELVAAFVGALVGAVVGDAVGAAVGLGEYPTGTQLISRTQLAHPSEIVLMWSLQHVSFAASQTVQVVRLVLHRRPAVTFVGAGVGAEDGARVGTGDGTGVGTGEGTGVGADVGVADGAAVGVEVGTKVGAGDRPAA